MTTIYTDKDTYVDSLNPDANYGSASEFRVNPQSIVLWRSYLEFDMTGITIADIASANLYAYVGSGYTNARDHLFQRTTSQFVENTITWNTGIPSITNVNSVVASITMGTWQTIDVTSMCKNSSGNYFGIEIRDNNEGTSWDRSKRYSSANAGSNNPYLLLTFSDKYVDIATGSDADSGNTWADAYLTVKKGIDNLPANDNLHIAEGDYSAQAAIDLDQNMNLICEDYGGGNASPPLTVVLPVTV